MGPKQLSEQGTGDRGRTASSQRKGPLQRRRPTLRPRRLPLTLFLLVALCITGCTEGPVTRAPVQPNVGLLPNDFPLPPDPFARRSGVGWMGSKQLWTFDAPAGMSAREAGETLRTFYEERLPEEKWVLRELSGSPEQWVGLWDRGDRWVRLSFGADDPEELSVRISDLWEPSP